MSIVSINSKKAKLMIEKDEFDLIIDLRTKELYENYNIKGSINIPFNEIGDKMNFLKEYKNKKILLYCEVGKTSKSASKVLAINGFSKIYNLSQGLKGYK